LVQDDDLRYGDTLSFFWGSSEDGAIGYTQNVSGVVLTPGDHILSITVTDENGTEAMETITVTVKADPNPPKPDPKPGDNDNKPSDGDGTDTDNGDSTSDSSDFGGMMMIMIIVIVVVIVLVMVALMFMKRKKKDEETKSAGDGQATSPEISSQGQMPMQQFPQQMQPMGPMQQMQQVPVQENPQAPQPQYLLSEQDKLLFEQTKYEDQGPQVYDQTMVVGAPEQLQQTQETQETQYTDSTMGQDNQGQTQKQDNISDDDPLSNAKYFSLPEPEE